MGKRWSKEEDAEMTELLKTGIGYKEIAKVLGRTVDALMERAYSTGNSKRKLFTQRIIDKTKPNKSD